MKHRVTSMFLFLTSSFRHIYPESRYIYIIKQTAESYFIGNLFIWILSWLSWDWASMCLDLSSASQHSLPCSVFIQQWFSAYTLYISNCSPPLRGLSPPAARQPLPVSPPPPPPPCLRITVAKKLTYLRSWSAASPLLCLLMTELALCAILTPGWHYTAINPYYSKERVKCKRQINSL